jgi:hypothetical protein
MLPSDLRSHRTLNSQSAVGNNFLVKSSVPTKRRCTIEENALGVDMYWYNSLEKELDHVQNALQILGGKRDQFPPEP